MLEMAVVDICMLVATSHALKAQPADAGDEVPRRLRRLLRRQLRYGTLAYLAKLVRARREEPDEALLARCRRAAENEMPDAISHQDWLSRVMRGQSGALLGLATARQDLWRLAHLAARLRASVLAVGQVEVSSDAQHFRTAARRLRRRLRKALVSYANTLLGVPAATGTDIAKARRRALAEIGRQGLGDAERMEQWAAVMNADSPALRAGLLKGLDELLLDWTAE